MWVPRSSPGLAIDHRRVLIPVSLAFLVLLYFLVTPPLWVMMLAALVLPAYLLGSAVYVARREQAFEREFNLLLQRRATTELRQLVARAGWLRLAPPGTRDARLGLVALAAEDWGSAEEHLERAYILSSEGTMRRRMLPALLRAKYENGLWDEAREIAEDLVVRSEFPGTAELFLGLILVRDEETRERGVALLEEAARSLPGSDRERAERALAELRTA